MADAENGNGSSPHDPLVYPLSRGIARRTADRRDTPPQTTAPEEDRIAAVARDLHAEALQREGVRRISVTVVIVNGKARARCVSLVRESIEVPLDPLVKR